MCGPFENFTNMQILDLRNKSNGESVVSDSHTTKRKVSNGIQTDDYKKMLLHSLDGLKCSYEWRRTKMVHDRPKLRSNNKSMIIVQMEATHWHGDFFLLKCRKSTLTGIHEIYFSRLGATATYTNRKMSGKPHASFVTHFDHSSRHSSQLRFLLGYTWALLSRSDVLINNVPSAAWKEHHSLYYSQRNLGASFVLYVKFRNRIKLVRHERLHICSSSSTFLAKRYWQRWKIAYINLMEAEKLKLNWRIRFYENELLDKIGNIELKLISNRNCSNHILNNYREKRKNGENSNNDFRKYLRC